ncbi:AI-2E family transporter [Halapricum hydrolyticum]|uniref:AI-2E family transporter n=1 Tax=Halapricum hydrolyticum TaxID=2979991 RepID=A0AAE3I8V9_9EURY|nr:AI-2E family transporter [Halapricum hydrolyticum]MCU4716458.1 AI-2E family transporter [Halapricum hydrolyticum]MCU4725938.1 AI-2E family transporter [Halapricum hydrolyticum]
MDRARAIVVGLAGVLLVLAALLVHPFLEFVLLAVLLAFPLRPLQRRFEGRFGERTTAAGLVVGATVTVLLPLAWLMWVVIREATTFVERVQRGEIDFSAVETSIRNVTGQDIDLLETARRTLQETGIGTVDGAIGAFGTAADLLIGTALTIFLLYYFLKDADRFGRWLERTVPMSSRVYDQLREEFNDVMWAVLVSHVFIAVVQGVVAGLGLVVFGVPNATFWTVVMIFLAVMPIIGSFLVWGPAVVYLLSVERPIAGVALLVYGTIVVSFTDDFLRPLVIDRYTETRLNPGAIVLGVIGGIYVFGFIGVFFGPVVIGALRAVLDVYRREYVEDVSTATASE